MKHRIRSAVIIVDDNKILLIKHVHPKTGIEWWVPPGGGVEETDVSIFECAKREAFEEANLNIDASRVVYIREFHDKEDNVLNVEFFVLADSYIGEVNIRNIAGSGPDEQYIKKAEWFTKEDLQDITVYPEILKDSFWEDYKNSFPEIKYLGRQK
jgi:8-oxo-dGTP diphosphatase